MKCHRTTAGGFLLALALGLTAVAVAAPAGKPPKQIVFPLVGPAQYFAGDFGAPRPQGPHEGNDIMSVRHAPAVAAEAGKVEFETGSGRAGCMLTLHGKSGTDYVYIHLNNDLGPTNDNKGNCVGGVSYAKGLKSGQKVAAGQLVGYVGDSGDADGLQPHLHFEIHPNGGAAVDPYDTLQAAHRLLFYALPGTTFTLQLSGTVVGNDKDPSKLRLKTDSVRWWPNGMKVDGVNRTLTIDGRMASVESESTRVPKGATAPGGGAKKGQKVAVYTMPAPTTRDAQLGKPGQLVASRIVLLDN
jgi:hypothetical protein